MYGDVHSLRELHSLALGRRSVVVPSSRGFGKPRPAAFMINLPGMILLDLFQKGMYLYKKEPKSCM